MKKMPEIGSKFFLFVFCLMGFLHEEFSQVGNSFASENFDCEKASGIKSSENAIKKRNDLFGRANFPIIL
jgi:hypothetical protein